MIMEYHSNELSKMYRGSKWSSTAEQKNFHNQSLYSGEINKVPKVSDLIDLHAAQLISNREE